MQLYKHLDKRIVYMGEDPDVRMNKRKAVRDCHIISYVSYPVLFFRKALKPVC